MSSRSGVAQIVLFLIGVMACQGAEEVYAETKDNDHWFLTLVVPVERVKLPHMEKVAVDFLGRAASHKVAVLSVFNTREIAAMERGTSCGNYKQWRVDYNYFPRGRLAAANMIAIGGNAVLRLRSADGTVTRRVLKGEDPTQLSIDGTRFEILVIGGRRMTRFQACATAGAIEPNLYIRTSGKLSRELCERAVNWLAGMLRSRHLGASFRNDYWFPCGQFFPVLYPFFPPEEPLSESAYHKSVTFTCAMTCEGKADCLQTMGPPVGGVPLPQ
jgi:hypothetical protein